FQRSLPALLRVEIERGIASVVWQRQQLGKQCGIADRSRRLRQQSVELVEFCLRRIVVLQSGGTVHLADDRIKGAVGVLRGAEIPQAGVRFGGEAFPKRDREPRFADAGLAVRPGRTVSSISFSRNTASYFSRPRLRGQPPRSMMAL